ncbi:GGDEF domain-containing protein [Konateibacter massiliensis]|uniref:GGDEF domain-containing protein n=1 Tax=Konateibacter massiliensis TaxID=2002841 RepID=UPI000C15DA94|nr:GGDEF domain-containing protein [Konateibacter massiliensis]
MVFKTLGELLYVAHALESINTSVCIKDADGEIIYESFQKNFKHDKVTEYIKKIMDTLQHSQEATFKILTVDSRITAVTAVPIVIGAEHYQMELKQNISKTWQYNSDIHRLDNMSIHQIKELAVTDALTKLYNRRYIDERLPIDMQSSFELDKPISILFVDIDYFKTINDTHGHGVGDKILQELAILLQQEVQKENGWAARYGGDEILICLPGIPKNDAKRIANRLRSRIESNTFRMVKQKIDITCSIGVKTVGKASGVQSIGELMDMADKNLYKAKREGRNKVV